MKNRLSVIKTVVILTFFIISIFSLIRNIQYNMTIKSINSNIINLEAENRKLKEENKTYQEKVKALSEYNSVFKSQNEKLESQLQEYKNKKVKIAYLTFDDGPSINTPKILDILKQKDIKATFFVNGRPNMKSTYKRIVADGHTLGNHTYSHQYSNIYSSPGNFLNDACLLNNFLHQTVGFEPNIIRIPGGSNNTVSIKYGGKDIMNKIVQEVKGKGWEYFDWNVSGGDAAKAIVDKNTIVNNVLQDASRKSEAIILLHDSNIKTTTVDALPEIIDGLKSKGFIFKSLSYDTPAIHFLK